MHLDTVLTMVDRDAITAFPTVVGNARVWIIRPGDSPDEPVIEEDPNGILSAMKAALGLSDIRVITTAGDDFGQEREQWDDGNNLVALEPGVVVAYEPTPARTPNCARRASRSSPGTLGIATLDYLPYCFLNLLNPVISFAYAITGFQVKRIDPAEPDTTTATSPKLATT